MLGRKCERFKKYLTHNLRKNWHFFFSDEPEHMLKSLEKYVFLL